MGCGAGRSYTERDVTAHISKGQTRLPSAELVDGDVIKLTSKGGFFNASSLLDAQWLKGKMTNSEYRQAIEHINERVGQSVVGSSARLSIDDVPKSQSAKLAVDELNEKYRGRVQFAFRRDEKENSMSNGESFILISFK